MKNIDEVINIMISYIEVTWGDDARNLDVNNSILYRDYILLFVYNYVLWSIDYEWIMNDVQISSFYDVMMRMKKKKMNVFWFYVNEDERQYVISGSFLNMR